MSFKDKLKKKGAMPTLGVNQFLDSEVQADVVARAVADGRFLQLSPDRFLPDPQQPRKTFDSAKLTELQISIETEGQLQPILVGEPLEDGRYPIIAGERRWRAISQSSTVTKIDAVVRDGTIDELHVLKMQIEENNQREQIPAIENAFAMKRFVDITRGLGGDQEYAAELLRISPGHLSKHLALLGASSLVTSLSTNGETQDVEVLYNLSQIAESKPDEAAALIEAWRSGALEGNFRSATKNLVKDIKQERNESENSGRSSNSKAVVEEPKPKKIDGISLSLDGETFILTVQMGLKKLPLRLSPELVIALKGDITKNWS